MDSQKLGHYIAEKRKQRGLTQRDLADHLHVTDKAISKWERGLGLPDIKMIEPLADALNVSVLEVMHSEDLTQETLPIDQVSQVLNDTIDLASHYRKIERRNALIACLIVIALVTTVFLIDHSGPLLFVMLYLPIIMFGIGIMLLISSFRRWRRKLPFSWTLIAGTLSVLYPFAFFVFFLYGWFAGGGAPN